MLDSLPYRIQTDLPPKDIQLAADCRRSRDKRLPADVGVTAPLSFFRIREECSLIIFFKTEKIPQTSCNN
jgi:hypothetical protein